MASTYLTRTPSSAGTQTKATISVWFKRSDLSVNQCIFSTGNNNFVIKFGTTDKIGIYDYNGSSFDLELSTTQSFRDVSAWYHIVLSLDSTQSTNSDRAKLYVNGSLISNFDSTTYPSQNYNFKVNGTLEHFIGRLSGLSQYFDGSISHFHMVDGTAYDASAFGETDTTTGEWKAKTSPSVTYGTNGFLILKDGNTITDQSSNSNDFTLGGGTLTDLKDNPDNVFATLNPLFKANGQATTFSNGNTTGQSPTTDGCAGTSTIGVSSGKYYAEFKQVTETSSGEGVVGICDTYYISNNSSLGGSSSPGYLEYSVGCFGYRNNNGDQFYSSSGSKYASSNNHAGWSNGDIIMVALDMDNNRVYLGKNGSWNASNTWSSATPSQYITIDSTGFEGNYHFAIGDSSGGNRVTWNANFGNGYFGTTAVSSAGTNASDNGIFEYDVPTGYTALSTKGLNE